MKIYFAVKINSLWLNETKKFLHDFPDVECINLNGKEQKEIHRAEIIIGGIVKKELLLKALNLKVIMVPYAGVNQLPLELLKERNVRVSNVHENAAYVAERAVALALCFLGKVIDYHNDLRAEKWHGWAAGGVNDTWISIQGKKCAIIGAGRIGGKIAEMLHVFDCTVTGFKRKEIDYLPPFYDKMVYDIDEAIKEGEIIFLCLPLTEETRGIINKERLSMMKGKLLINIGRGDIINEEALYLALKNKNLAGAAIDSWFCYPKDKSGISAPSRFPIHKLPNVILSPHVAGITRQSAAREVEKTFENLKNYLKNGCLQNEIDLDSAY